MEQHFEPETTVKSTEADILHPDDAQYIWLPFSVLVGIFVLAALVRYIPYRRLFAQVNLHLFNLCIWASKGVRHVS